VTENASKKPVTTLVLAIELADPKVLQLAQQLATLREATRAFVPLLVSSCPSLKAIRELGILHEYVIPYPEWSASRDPAAWGTYVLNRVKLINNEARPGNIMIAGDLLKSKGIDRNLYGAFLTLTPPPPPQPEAPDPVKEELSLINMNLTVLDERLTKVARSIRRLQPPNLAE
jgi:hypothetical protein